MYNKLKWTAANGQQLKQYHHVTITQDFRSDCIMWLFFLNNSNSSILCRPFSDFEDNSITLDIYSDASRSEKLGFAAIFGDEYVWGQWEPGYIRTFNPSIAYLELFALCIGIFTWLEKLQGCYSNIKIFCDNTSVKDMVNVTSTGCINCMQLVRMLVLDGLVKGQKITVEYVKSRDNGCADALLRLNFKRFFRLSPSSLAKGKEQKLPGNLWLASKIWIKP